MNTLYEGHKIVKVGEYPAIYYPSHAKANNSGMVYIHILQAEKLLGRDLRKQEVVHHKDFDKNNYAKENLMVFADIQNHTRYHKALDTNIDYFLIRQDDIYYCVVGKGLINQAIGLYGLQQSIPSQMRAICPLCGSWMSTRAKVCGSCYNKQKTNSSKRPSKKQLITQLNQHKNFVTVGKLYGVSDNAIRKWCSYYGLPTKSSEWNFKP